MLKTMLVVYAPLFVLLPQSQTPTFFTHVSDTQVSTHARYNWSVSGFRGGGECKTWWMNEEGFFCWGLLSGAITRIAVRLTQEHLASVPTPLYAVTMKNGTVFRWVGWARSCKAAMNKMTMDKIAGDWPMALWTKLATNAALTPSIASNKRASYIP